MGFNRLKSIFRKNKKVEDVEENKTSVSRSRSLRLTRSHQPSIMNDLDQINLPKSTPSSPAEFTFTIQEKPNNRTSFVKAVNVVKNLNHASSVDAFNTFFPENACQKRASFMLLYLKKEVFLPIFKNLDLQLMDNLLQIIGDRLFTLFYVIKVIKSGSLRSNIMLEAQSLVKQSGLSNQSYGIRETGYAVYFALQEIELETEIKNQILKKSYQCIGNCIEKELKLSESEKESMYLFQTVVNNINLPTPKLLVDKA